MLSRLKHAWDMLQNCGFLSSNRFRSFFLYTKEPLENLMFGSMMRQSWFVALGASSIYMVMMPMFSFVLIGLALVDIYELIRAEKKTLDLWLNALIGSMCACLATTSITLLEISLLTGVTFAIGPWFFLASVCLFSCNALFQTGLNIWRAVNAPHGSQLRLDYIQTAMNWAFIFATVFSVIGCVVFVILFSDLCVTAGAICAGLTVALTSASLVWRLTPSSFKSEIKQAIGLEYKQISSDEAVLTDRPSIVVQPEGTSQKKLLDTDQNDGLLSWLFQVNPAQPSSHVNIDEIPTVDGLSPE